MSKLIGKAIKEINATAEFRAENYDVNSITWLNGTTPIPVADIQAKITELETADNDAKTKRETDKANAKAKLIAGEPLTEDEANTVVL